MSNTPIPSSSKEGGVQYQQVQPQPFASDRPKRGLRWYVWLAIFAFCAMVAALVYRYSNPKGSEAVTVSAPTKIDCGDIRFDDCSRVNLSAFQKRLSTEKKASENAESRLSCPEDAFVEKHGVYDLCGCTCK